MPLYTRNNKLLLGSGVSLRLAGSNNCCCGGPPPPPPEDCDGACCEEFQCSQKTLAECSESGGLWLGCDYPCSETLCDEALTCADCCDDFLEEISMTITTESVSVCYTTSTVTSGAFTTINIWGVTENFAVSETITLELIEFEGACALYTFDGVVARTRIIASVYYNLVDGQCQWSLQDIQITQCSEATSDTARDGCLGDPYKYGAATVLRPSDLAEIYPTFFVRVRERGANGCTGTLTYDVDGEVGFDSGATCNPAANRYCNDGATTCSPVTITGTVTITAS